MPQQYRYIITKSLFILTLICFTSTLSNSNYGQGIDEPLFTHGVASGDPLPNAVIIWTRVSRHTLSPVTVKWTIAKDKKMTQVVKSGELITDRSTDYTVKVDAAGLLPATDYYYQFKAGHTLSVVGKTKTAPLGNPVKLQFAVVSCSNYAEGYFTALDKIAARNTLDAVIHLGDYIYEGTQRNFNSRAVLDSEETTIVPSNKAEWLAYYRKRYAVSHLDSNLQHAHQQLPFINIWDDHETVDNAHKDGSYMHDPQSHGLWEDRKAAAKQAYAEWLPIRGDASRIYRSLKFGNLMELILLDTRLEGRDPQITNAADNRLYDENRTILGNTQRQWLLQKLSSSTATWKVIGNQVIFSDFHVEWAAGTGLFADKIQQLENNLLDYWQGYPAERHKLLSHIEKNKINNVVILSASMHCALAFDVFESDEKKNTPVTYVPATGKGSLAVEFATPSISSANFDEKIGFYTASAFEASINTTLPLPFNMNPNPHMKFVDLDQHGYFILELTQQRAKASWYFVESVLVPIAGEELAESWYTDKDQNHLQQDAEKRE